MKYCLTSALLLVVSSLAAVHGSEPPAERQELMPLPLGSITARGWMRTLLERNRDGMGGHYGEFDPNQFELPGAVKDYDAHLPGAPRGEMPGWCAEMSGEYRLGQLELAETLGDSGLQQKFRAWRDALLAGQEADGYLGGYRPKDDHSEDYNGWGTHFYYRALLLEHSRTQDSKLLAALHRGLLWFVKHWEGERKSTYVGPTIIWPMVEVYKLTGDVRLRSFCEDYAVFLDRRANWNPYRAPNNSTGGFARLSLAPASYHTVAYAVRAQLPGILSLANGKADLLAASVASLDNHLAQIGWQGSYAPVADWERLSYPSAVGETEYCNFISWMEYLQWLTRLTGEARFGDLIERLAFNAAMGGRKKDERAIAYNTSPNQFRATKTSARAGCMPYYGVYCPCEFAACCTAQSIRLIPAYLLKSVMATRSGDLAFCTYGPCRVETDSLTIACDTQYPFEETVRLHVAAKKKCWAGALRFRVPAWATECALTRDGASCVTQAKDGWITLPGPWTTNDLTLAFMCKPVVRPVRERGMAEPLRTVEWGPLVFAQPMKELWTPVEAASEGRPLPPGWPWFDVTCAEKPPLYALPVKTVFGADAIQVKRVATDGYPWEEPPVRLVVPMVRAPGAYAESPETLQHNTPPRVNPVDAGNAQVEAVELVPFGATCLRVSCFPVAR